MRLKLTFEMMNLDDRIIAVPVGEHVDEYHGVIKLNETAAFIFEKLKEDTTEEAIVNAMKQEYDAPRSQIAADVHKYILDFQKKGLLIG